MVLPDRKLKVRGAIETTGILTAVVDSILEVTIDYKRSRGITGDGSFRDIQPQST